MMKVLVTGDRNWDDLEAMAERLSFLPSRSVIVEGEAPGADTMARLIGEQLGFEVRKYPADWAKYKRAAGPIRNQQMLDSEGPFDLVIAFHKDLRTSKGTLDMVKRALRAGVPVSTVPDQSDFVASLVEKR